MIQVKNLTKSYGPRVAVRNLNFEVKAGEIVGFLGPNGAGKSTTMKILTGFMAPTSGQALVAGHDVSESPLEVKRNIGYLPETPPVYMEMQVEDFVAFAARLHEVPKSQVKSKVDTALERTGLQSVRRRLIGNLSKGYRQRVGLAQALVHNPKVLILDEPTVGLDPVQIIEIRQLIKSLAGQHTVILSSHILPEVTVTCQRIIVISNGEIVAQDTLDRLTKAKTKGSTFTLEVKDSNAAGIEAIRKLPGIVDVNSAGNRRLTIQLKPESADIRDRIVETAVQNRMGVLECYGERQSLEEVFLYLTQQEDTRGVRP